MSRDRSSEKALRDFRREHKLCTHCGKPAAFLSAKCEHCTEVQRRADGRRRAKELKRTAGLRYAIVMPHQSQALYRSKQLQGA